METILHAVAGSRLYGTNDEQSDFDYVSVNVDSYKDIAGFLPLQPAPKGAAGKATQPGELDHNAYGLRKFLKLASDGNPNMLELMFVRPEHCPIRTPLADEMLALVPYMISKSAGRRCVGYMRAQARKLSAGTLGMTNEYRKNLRDTYGYDTKYAAHIFRLYYQGMSLMLNGTIVFPLDRATEIKAIKNGSIALKDIDSAVAAVVSDLEAAVARSAHPDTANTKAVERWLLNAYRKTWGL